jgi:broad specificity phosphatase PhoE
MSYSQTGIKRYGLPVAVIAVLSIIIVGYTYWLKQPTVVLIIRHAEKASVPGNNQPLSPTGQERAQTLVHVAGEAGVGAIYATQFLRTQQTVQPLASHLGIPITQVNAADIDGLINQLWRDHPGRVVLIAGHDTTVPQIIEKLGGGRIAPIAPDKFDNLFIVVIPLVGKVKTVHMKYGNPN